jgi:hypothetical protein
MRICCDLVRLGGFSLQLVTHTHKSNILSLPFWVKIHYPPFFILRLFFFTSCVSLASCLLSCLVSCLVCLVFVLCLVLVSGALYLVSCVFV